MRALPAPPGFLLAAAGGTGPLRSRVGIHGSRSWSPPDNARTQSVACLLARMPFSARQRRRDPAPTPDADGSTAPDPATQPTRGILRQAVPSWRMIQRSGSGFVSKPGGSLPFPAPKPPGVGTVRLRLPAAWAPTVDARGCGGRESNPRPRPGRPAGTRADLRGTIDIEDARMIVALWLLAPRVSSADSTPLLPRVASPAAGAREAGRLRAEASRGA